MKRGTIEHIKTRRLARALNVRLLEAVGLLEALWHLTGRQAPSGDIGRFTDDEIADGCFWEGRRTPAELVAALVVTGWLEKSDEHRLVVHDWHEHADNTTRTLMQRKGVSFVSGEAPRRIKTSVLPTHCQHRDIPPPTQQREIRASSLEQPALEVEANNSEMLQHGCNHVVPPILSYPSLSEEDKSKTPLPPQGGGRGRPRKTRGPKPLPALSFPAEIDTPEFHEAWDKWIAYRRGSALSLFQDTLQAQLDKCAIHGQQKAVAAIRDAIGGSWRGLVFKAAEPPLPPSDEGNPLRYQEQADGPGIVRVGSDPPEPTPTLPPEPTPHQPELSTESFF